MTPAELEQRIDTSVAAAIADGWTIVNCVYFVPSAMECCALSACVLSEMKQNMATEWPWRRLDSSSIIDSALGLSARQRSSFTDGFDRIPLLGHHDEMFHRLGQRMRAKHILGSRT